MPQAAVRKQDVILPQGDITNAEALALFDELEPVDVTFMLGRWRGAGLPTQHPMDGLLEAYNWYGKEFIDSENVDPLLFRSRKGQFFRLNPTFMPATLAARLPFLQSGIVRAAFALVNPLLRTRQHKARLRMTEYRGKSSATMIYDNLPINDIFRRLDDNSVMGVMDLKGIEQPFFFLLYRDA